MSKMTRLHTGMFVKLRDISTVGLVLSNGIYARVCIPTDLDNKPISYVGNFNLKSPIKNIIPFENYFTTYSYGEKFIPPTDGNVLIVPRRKIKRSLAYRLWEKEHKRLCEFANQLLPLSQPIVNNSQINSIIEEVFREPILMRLWDRKFRV